MSNTKKSYASGAHAKFGLTPMPTCPEWNPFPSRAKKASPLQSSDPSLGCGQPAPPLQCWWLRNTVLKQEWNDFSHRETCPHFGAACSQHCIDWGCGGAARRGWRGRFFRSGRTRLRWCCIAMFACACETLAMTPTAFDPAAMVLHCYVCACV